MKSSPGPGTNRRVVPAQRPDPSTEHSYRSSPAGIDVEATVDSLRRLSGRANERPVGGAPPTMIRSMTALGVPLSAVPGLMLHLQRTIGNQATVRLLRRDSPGQPSADSHSASAARAAPPSSSRAADASTEAPRVADEDGERALAPTIQRAAAAAGDPPIPPPADSPGTRYDVSFELTGNIHASLHLKSVSASDALRALERVYFIIHSQIETSLDALRDLRRIHEDQYVVAWISDHLSGSELPDDSIFAEGQALLAAARSTLDGGAVTASVRSLQQAANSWRRADQQVTAYREGTVQGAERAVVVLEVTEAAGAVAATVATGGLAGEGLLATSAVASATAGAYGMAQQGAGQASELAAGIRQHFDVGALLRRGLTDAVTGFVGAYTGGALTGRMSRLFGSYLSEASPELLEELGRLNGLAGPLPRDYFLTTGQRLIRDFLASEAAVPLTSAVSAVIQQASGRTTRMPTVEEFTRSVFTEMIKGGAFTLLTGTLHAHFAERGVETSDVGEPTPSGEGSAPSADVPASADAASPARGDQASVSSLEPSSPSLLDAGGESSPISNDQVPPSSPASETAGPEGIPSAPRGAARGGAKAMEEGPIENLPAGSVIRADNALDALHMYENCIRDAPDLEAAVFHNSRTNQHIVVQGDENAVGPWNQVETPPGQAESSGMERPLGPAGPGQRSQSWKEILDEGEDVGEWQLDAHWHPIQRSTGVAAPSDQFPSGAGGDFQVLIGESREAGGARRTSRIHYTTQRGRESTVFAYDPSADQPYHVDYPNAIGQRQQADFGSLAEYQAWLNRKFSGRLTLRPVPAWIARLDAQTAGTRPDIRLPTFDDDPTQPGAPAPDFDDEPTRRPSSAGPAGSSSSGSE